MSKPKFIQTDGLTLFLGEFDFDLFQMNYWSKAPLYISRIDKARFSHLCSFRELDKLILNGQKEQDHLHIATGQKQPSDFISEWFNALQEQFASRYTISIHHSNSLSQTIARLVREFENAFGVLCSASLFFGRENAKQTEAHFDNIDAYIFQIDGIKRWRIYEPITQLPLPEDETIYYDEKELENLILDIELSPGDSLYLPRGFIHKVTPIGSASMHLTIGVSHVQIWEVIQLAISELSTTNKLYRESFSQHFFSTSEIDLIKEVELLIPEAIKKVRSILVKKFSIFPDGYFEHTLHLDSLNEDSVVSIKEPLLSHFYPNDESTTEPTIHLEFPGKLLNCPVSILPILDNIFKKVSFMPKELPSLNNFDDTLNIIKILVIEGFLTIENTMGNLE